MIGTLINTCAVVVGGSLGLIIGGRLPNNTRNIVMSGIGLFVVALGVSSAIKTENPIIPLVALVLGSLAGEAIDIDRGVNQLGEWLKRRFDRPGSNHNFTLGFVLASLQACVGPLTIIGSLEDGISGDYSLLAIKSVLDGFSAIVFASVFGVGTIFAAATVLIVQGCLTLLAGQLKPLLVTAPLAGMSAQPRVIELAAVGGIILIGLGLNILELKTIKIANMLPALIVAPFLVAFLNLLGVPVDFGLAGR